MNPDNNDSITAAPQAPALVPGGLADSARQFAALWSASAKRTNPPNGNTGGILCHPNAEGVKSPANAGCDMSQGGTKSSLENSEGNLKSTKVAKNTPPLRVVADDEKPKKKRTRAKQTAPGLAALLDGFFFDWLTITAMNPATGKGVRRPLATRKEAIEDMRFAESWYDRAALWAVSQGLHQSRVGRGTDGYRAGAVLVAKPGSPERVASIRAGHATNMPGIEIPGGLGMAAKLAPSALECLGAVLVARADAAFDYSHPDLMEGLIEYAKAASGTGAGKGMEPPSVIEKDGAKTMYWGRDEVRVRVYQKDLERVARGHIKRADADPNLVRVEFIFRPKKAKKAAFAALSPGQMVRTSVWARRMVEHLGQIIGIAKEGDVLARQEIKEAPDPRTYEERAEAGVSMYARTLCGAAVARLVDRRFGGNWALAEIQPDAVENEVMAMVREVLRTKGAAARFVEENGLVETMNDRHRAAFMQAQMVDFLKNQAQKDKEAQAALHGALVRAGVREAGQDGEGVQSSEASGPSSVRSGLDAESSVFVA